MTPQIVCLGAGRMGRGIAVVFAFAGHDVTVIDFKPRTPAAFAELAAEVQTEIVGTLAMLARIGLMRPEQAAHIAARVSVVSDAEAVKRPWRTPMSCSRVFRKSSR